MLGLTLMSCEGSEAEKEVVPAVKEGKITYSVSYPYYKDDFMVVMLPDVMTMEFKNNVYKNTVTKGGLFTTALIADCNKKELTLILDFGSKQIYTKLDQALTDTMMLSYPVPSILQVNNFDSIASKKCEKFMAVYSSLEDGYDCEIYTTKEVDIQNSNWCNQFNELPDVMLGYEVSQYGLVTRFQADSVTAMSISDDAFVVPDGFKEVSLEQMLFQMEEIFKQIIE